MGQGFEAVLRALGGFASVEVEPEDLQNSSSSARGRQVGGGIGAARATYAAQRGDQSAGTEAFGKTWASWGQPWSASASPPRAAAAWRAVTATAVGLGDGWVHINMHSNASSHIQYILHWKVSILLVPTILHIRVILLFHFDFFFFSKTYSLLVKNASRGTGCPTGTCPPEKDK